MIDYTAEAARPSYYYYYHNIQNRQIRSSSSHGVVYPSRFRSFPVSNINNNNNNNNNSSSFSLAPTMPHLNIVRNNLSYRGMSSTTATNTTSSTSTKVVVDSVMAEEKIMVSSIDNDKEINNNKENNNDDDEEIKTIEKLPLSQRARLLFKKYGYTFVGTYITLYWSVLLTFYVGLDSGLLDPDVLTRIFTVSKDMVIETADIVGPTGSGASMEETVTAYATEMSGDINKDKRTLVDIVSGYLTKYEWSKKYADHISENPHLANLAVAWFMVKFTEPVRLGAAVVMTPKIAKALGIRRDNSKAAAMKNNKIISATNVAVSAGEEKRG